MMEHRRSLCWVADEELESSHFNIYYIPIFRNLIKGPLRQPGWEESEGLSKLKFLKSGPGGRSYKVLVARVWGLGAQADHAIG